MILLFENREILHQRLSPMCHKNTPPGWRGSHLFVRGRRHSPPHKRMEFGLPLSSLLELQSFHIQMTEAIVMSDAVMATIGDSTIISWFRDGPFIYSSLNTAHDLVFGR